MGGLSFGLPINLASSLAQGLPLNPGGSTAFNPATVLFGAGEQGLWYDPSDLSSMFQDSAGTVPVTAVGQVVGKINDKSGRGNHATQATTASKPTLSARHNLVTYSEDFTNAAWTKEAGLTATGNTTTAPDGTTTADTITATAGSAQHRMYLLGAAGLGPAQSAYFKAGTHNFIILSDGNNTCYANFNLSLGTITQSAGCTPAIEAVGSGWYRCKLNATIPAASEYFCAQIAENGTTAASALWTAAGTETVHVWGAQLEAAQSVGPYQWINAAGVYNETGFNRYLSFDGVDDSMLTAAIDFTATDKMFACLGQQAASTVSTQVELDFPNTGANALGGMTIYVGANAQHIASGTSLNDYGYAATGPIKSVVTSTVDRAGSGASEFTLRENGLAKALTATLVGDATGNFASGALYLGSRSGPTLPFKGRFYQVILRGAVTADADRNATETFVNSKTGAY